MPDEHFSPKVKTRMILQFPDTGELKKIPSHADACRLAEEKYRVWMSQQDQREKDQRRACTMYGRCECGHTHAYARYRSEGHGRECPFSPLYPGDLDNPPGWIALAAGDKEAGDKEAGQGTGQGLEGAGRGQGALERPRRGPPANTRPHWTKQEGRSVPSTPPPPGGTSKAQSRRPWPASGTNTKTGYPGTPKEPSAGPTTGPSGRSRLRSTSSPPPATKACPACWTGQPISTCTTAETAA